MSNNRYITETVDKEHIHFGGIIYSSDYVTDYRSRNNTNGSSIASRIASDFRWERNTLQHKNTKKESISYKLKFQGDERIGKKSY